MQKLLNRIEYITRKVNASRIGAYAAQTAFFMFLSLMPLVILLISFLQQLGSSTEVVSGIANELAPEFLSNFFETYINEIIDESKLSLTVVSAIVLLWSASKGIFAVIGGLNSVYEIKENRSYFVLRLLAMLYTVAFLIILVAALMLMVFGGYFGELLYSLFPNFKGIVYLVTSLRFVLSFIALTLFFSLMYKSLPNEKMKFTDQLPGAVISSAGWVVFSMGFSFFVNNFSNYANIYGSLTTIIVLLLWLYVCMYIMFFGAQMNLILSDKRR